MLLRIPQRYGPFFPLVWSTCDYRSERWEKLPSQVFSPGFRSLRWRSLPVGSILVNPHLSTQVWEFQIVDVTNARRERPQFHPVALLLGIGRRPQPRLEQNST